MKLLFFVVLLLVFATVALLALKKRRTLNSASSSWPYYAKRPLSQPEQVLYQRLVKAVPEHIVLAQVQVSRVLGVKKGFNFHEWNNRINRERATSAAGVRLIRWHVKSLPDQTAIQAALADKEPNQSIEGSSVNVC